MTEHPATGNGAGESASTDDQGYVRRETVGLLLGPLAFGLVYVGDPFALPAEPNAVLASTIWIALWWMSEAVPIPVTSLLPVVLFPFTGVGTVADSTTPYADPIIFLLLGGFLIALAIEYRELHRRIALTIVSYVGASPNRLLFGFMLATAVLSMWISNTATAMMMVPIGTAVVAQYVAMGDGDERVGDGDGSGDEAGSDSQSVTAGSGTDSVNGVTAGDAIEAEYGGEDDVAAGGETDAEAGNEGETGGETGSEGKTRTEGEAGSGSEGYTGSEGKTRTEADTDAESGSETDTDAVNEDDRPGPRDDVDAESLPRTRFGIMLMLGIAYAASIGGAATIIGSPPNAVFAGVAGASLGIDIGFFEWTLFALPASVIFLFVTWYLLVTVFKPRGTVERGIGAVVDQELEAMGSLGRAERRVLAVFGIVVIGWITRPFLLEPLFPALTDATIAVIGAVLLFVVPVDLKGREFLLEWDAIADLPWGVLILLGAGFSIANAFQTSGLDELIAGALAGFANLQLFVLLALVATVVVFLTEVNSNTATATVFMPIMIGLGVTLGVDPLGLMAVTALSASFAFMLPVATPPNAIVFGGGYLTIPDMVKIGVWLNVIGIVLSALLVYVWFPFVFG